MHETSHTLGRADVHRLNLLCNKAVFVVEPVTSGSQMEQLPSNQNFSKIFTLSVAIICV